MFGELKLATFHIEAVLEDHILRADLQPRGSLLQYMNDRNRSYIPFQNGEIFPFAVDRRVGTMQQSHMVVNKSALRILSVLNSEQAESVQVIESKRPVLFYIGHFVVQGHLHVSADAHKEDLLDDMRDYYPVSGGSIYSLRPVSSAPTQKVPLLLISRPLIQAYSVGEAA